MAGIAPNLPHHTRRVRVREALPHNARAQRVAGAPRATHTRVGETFMTAAQVRAELDRVSGRAEAMKRDIATATELDAATRADFQTWYASWRTFYRDAYDDWLAWGSNVTQAESFDAELDSWRTRYTELTGRAPSQPTTSATGRRYRSTTEWGSVIKYVAVALGVTAVAYAVTR